MIDIIIPSYNSHKTLEQTLFSIAYQDMASMLEVYIINDASNYDYKEFVEFFANFIKITELKLDVNSGPGVARQYGIEHSKNPYIMFVDSDDCLANCFAINHLYNNIYDGKTDLVISNFVEESVNEFIDHPNDNIWLHGKIYSRDFINKNKIRFNDSRSNEDNGFNQICRLMNARMKYIDVTTYVWRNNQSSITRSNNCEYAYNGLYGYAYNILFALEFGLKHNGNMNLISELSFSSLVSIYYYYLNYIDYDFSEILECAKKIKVICDTFNLDDNIKLELFKSQSDFSRENMEAKKILYPKISFEQFLLKLDEGDLDD